MLVAHAEDVYFAERVLLGLFDLVALTPLPAHINNLNSILLSRLLLHTPAYGATDASEIRNKLLVCFEKMLRTNYLYELTRLFLIPTSAL